MFNNRSMFGVLAAAMVAAPARGMMAAAPSAVMGSQFYLAPESTSANARLRQSLGWIGALPPKYRNRWKAQRPKRRANMLHVSRRTRRKHRRDARR